MKSIRIFAATFLSVLVFSACSPKRPEHVVIISFDGGKPDVMKQSSMPVTFQLAEEGAVSWKAQTITPSITLPSHVSMLTGVEPSKHMVLWNDWQPGRGLINRPSVFSIAKAHGLSTAIFAGKEKFKHLEVTNVIDKFEIPSGEALKIAAAVADHIVDKKPNLLFVHFPDSDLAGHKFGWGSPEQMASFADEDKALSLIMEALRKAGIDKRTVLIMSADHGGIAKGHGGLTPEEMTIPWIAWGTGVKKGTALTEKISTCDTAATTLWLFGLPVPGDWDGVPVSSAFQLKTKKSS